MQYTDCSYVGGSFEQKIFTFNIILYFLVRSLLLTYLITVSLEKEIHYCVRNLEFCDPKICTNPGKKRMSSKIKSLSNPNPFKISSLESHIP